MVTHTLYRSLSRVPRDKTVAPNNVKSVEMGIYKDPSSVGGKHVESRNV